MDKAENIIIYGRNACLEALNSNSDTITYTPENTLLFDIRFVDTILDENGEEQLIIELPEK